MQKQLVQQNQASLYLADALFDDGMMGDNFPDFARINIKITQK
jgi:hypothetical protein